MISGSDVFIVVGHNYPYDDENLSMSELLGVFSSHAMAVQFRDDHARAMLNGYGERAFDYYEITCMPVCRRLRTVDNWRGGMSNARYRNRLQHKGH